MKNGLDLPAHMAEHIDMFSGESGPVSFRADRSVVGDVPDWLGGAVRFSDETDEAVRLLKIRPVGRVIGISSQQLHKFCAYRHTKHKDAA